MTPVAPEKGRAVKRRWPTDDNPTDSEEEEHRQTSPVCKQCSQAIDRDKPCRLVRHSSKHLSFRPWKCSVCACTMSEKGNLQQHLNERHQGNGRVIDSRTAEYYDELEAKTKANFPAHSNAIAKYIGGQKEALGFQDASDHEDDNAQTRRKIFSCKECRRSIVSTRTWYLAEHSVAHLAIRPWKCSVCTFTAKLKSVVKRHLKEQHQGNGRIVDNRTAEYYDALEAKAQANFPDRARAIAKLIGGQRHVSGIQGGFDNEDATTPEDNPPIVRRPAPGNKSRVKQEVVLDAVPRRSKEKSTHRTMADTQREVKQEPLDVEHYSFDFHVVIEGSEADAHADAHAPIRHHNEQNVRNGDKDQSSSPTLHPIDVKEEILDENPAEEPRRIDKKKKKKVKRGEEDWAAEVAVLTIPSESPPFHATPSRVAVVQPRIEPVPQIDTDHSIDKRVEETIMTMKLGSAKISSGMARTRAAMRETKSDLARMQTNMALLETLSEARNAENRRLKQENDQQAAKLKMLLEERTALKERIRNDGW